MKILQLLSLTMALSAFTLAPVYSAGKENSPTVTVATPRMEVVFALDTTGSMSSMIEGAKRKIWAIANKLKSAQPTPEIRFGLVAYRDRGDDYVTKVFPLGKNLDEVYEMLASFKADGGGDTPESVNEALAVAVNAIEWSNDPSVLRAIFLVGDAPPHMDYGNDEKWMVTCRHAKDRGILINALQCGDDAATKSVWQEVAHLTGGAYLSILQSERTTAIETPYDQDIVSINRALSDTIIPYGTAEEQTSANRHNTLLDLMTPEGIADRTAFLGKDEFGTVISGKGDLVSDNISHRTSLDKIDPKQLSPALAALPVEERNKIVLQKVEKRRELLGQLKQLVEKRESEVATKIKAAEGTDDAIVLSPFEVLSQQAEDKGYKFNKK